MNDLSWNFLAWAVANDGLSSQIFGNSLELVDDGHRGFTGPVRRGVEAVIDVIMDQRPLRLADRLLDRMKLLSQVETGPAFSEHRDHLVQMTFGALQTADDPIVRFVNMIFGHVAESIPPRGIGQPPLCRTKTNLPRNRLD